jgi:RNA polymerase sigma-70 factor (ECF subfamily)
METRRRFARLVEPLAADLMAAAYRLTGDRADAEELTQETLVSAYKGIGKLNDTGSIRGWVFTIMKNGWRSRLRRADRRWPTVRDPATVERIADPNVVDPTDAGFDDRAQAALMTLPEEIRELLVAREVADMRYDEIAAAFGLPLGTVKSRIARGREKLKAAWLAGE